MENKTTSMRVDASFRKRVRDFIKEFEKERGVKLSEPQATKLIDVKIEKIGGIKV